MLKCFSYSKVEANLTPTEKVQAKLTPSKKVEAKLTPTEIELQKQTQQLKEENDKKENSVKNFFQFLNRYPQLVNEFEKAYATSRNQLLPPPPKPTSSGVQNPIVAEWDSEMHKREQFICKYRRLCEFIDKNPELKKTLVDQLEAEEDLKKQAHNPNSN